MGRLLTQGVIMAAKDGRQLLATLGTAGCQMRKVSYFYQSQYDNCKVSCVQPASQYTSLAMQQMQELLVIRCLPVLASPPLVENGTKTSRKSPILQKEDAMQGPLIQLIIIPSVISYILDLLLDPKSSEPCGSDHHPRVFQTSDGR
jgi:hypothetical protein